ncbi:CPBP family intramembrane metalloprotease [Streptococcus parasanguinis]|jgi:membrane protease YdiL (CAAX protease family)|uniref:CPBP family intramembrane glutamic endopeptidase n=1 Tax=Streptococcus parasanguinis TaxID=1318 RepID=UPI0012BBDBD3|nr:CPBP family intramembrane glutamic endopeptidase [Streptococcus parasanguinis]MBZ1355960.1 CPBP family intramembrane metalloprotease [Streptococcus sp. LPB0406]MDU5706256.1 CPBP family intramembrane glutamic endopeptidase [Streptococcus parasanguinis]MDU5844370.1 CPBP family intramembrane glutamic endopeptidase [Streptococcus parasanguinis]MTR54799.1 CPBP family intramembrane metalloprotease [Streptococcus parasanguinis]MTR56736.1 CPBP family intramembrane metalloprotease [Streptococcus par
MSRKQALSMYLLGTFGQVLGVSLLVWFLRAGGVKVDFTSPMGIIAVIVGGLSSALWGGLASISYHQSSFKQVLKDFFQVKQAPLNYLLVLIFIGLDFLPLVLSGKMIIPTWYLPIILFVKALVFGGIEEIGWRYFFQPTLQEKLTYIVSTLCTFVAWSLWHLLYFYIDGSLAMVNLIPFLLGLLSNCFILSAIYTKTRSLWLCVMTHALINALSQLSSTEESLGLSLVIKVLIIFFAMRIASSSMEKVKS